MTHIRLSFEFGAFLYCGSTGSAYYDEPKQAGGQGQRACGNDFKVNLKSELIIDDLHRKMDLVLENQKKINRRLDLLEQAENISHEQKKNIVSSSKKTLPQDNDSLT